MHERWQYHYDAYEIDFPFQVPIFSFTELEEAELRRSTTHYPRSGVGSWVTAPHFQNDERGGIVNANMFCLGQRESVC